MSATSGRKPRGRHPHQRLTALHVRHLKKGRYADGHGLYLFVEENGAKRWIWRGIIKGRRRDLGLGPIALVSLAEARAEALRIKTLVWKGGDPREERRRERKTVPTFRKAAKEVHAAHAATFRNEKHKTQWLSSLEADVFPVFGDRTVDTIESADVLRALTPIWNSKPETARRLKQRIRVVLDWAKASGHRSGDNPVDGITLVLPRSKKEKNHHPALPYAKVPAFLPTVRAADATMATKLAFEFLILTAARTSEVLMARWDEMDLEAKTWTIPALRMKAGREHRVPLSARCVELVESAKTIADGGPFVFPGRSPKAPLSNMAFLMLLRRVERTDITAHGFRSAFRDWAAEKSNAPRAVVEAALAHVVRDKTEAAYFRSDLFALRRKLMDNWARFATTKPAAVISIRA
jgi:integrase